MALEKKMIEQMLAGIDFKNLTTEEITGPNGLLKILTKRVRETAMNAEMDSHLGYEKHQKNTGNSSNARNGKSNKKVVTEIGDIQIGIPRDRNSEFEPKIIRKHQGRSEGFGDKIISMYSHGMTTRDI